jgi:hypothetical protein
MLKQSLLLGIISSALICCPCFAQGMQYDTSTITTTGTTSALSAAQVAQAAALAAQAAAAASARPQMYNGLPPTSLDSFVSNAGGSAELIYGDEGTDGLPPYYGFDPSHRINAGITSSGLTTGHGSYLPDAWGGDEFTGNEWSMSGSGGSSSNSTALAVQALLNMMGMSGL